ncbi:MAG: alpha/beta fold hydrolase [Dehalococcoidia bacterium]
MPLFGASGSRIGYEVHEGPAAAPPLLLFHGFTASSACWVSNLPGLTERFTTITVDLLGHGESDAPEEPALYGPEAAVGRIAGLLDELGYQQALVCGHSLGGALALRFALDAPGRVAGLVILNSNSAAGTPEWRESARVGMAAMATKARAEGTSFLRETRLYPASGTRLPQQARELLTRDFERLTPAGFAGTAEALVIDVNSFERLGTLEAPTLVMIGDRDADFAQSAPRFVVRMPHELVDTFTIEGGGHAANLEQPELFNEALFAFAERIGYLAPAGRFVPDIAPLLFPGASNGRDEPGLLAIMDEADDDELGPSLYTEIGETLRSRGRQLSLTVAGLGLVAMGAAMLVAAFFVGGGDDNGGSVAASGDEATATVTPTVVERAAGVRTAAPSSATASAVGGAEPSSTPVPTSTGAAVPVAPTPEPEDEPEPEEEPPADPPTPQATPEPTSEPTASPTPSGPWVAIGGPASGEAGEPLTFGSSESEGAYRRDWSASNGAAAAHAASFTVSFASPGCYSVTLTALFPSGAQSSTQVVAVGVESC